VRRKIRAHWHSATASTRVTADDANRKRFCPKSFEERKLEIPTTTNNTLDLHTSFEATPAACLQSSTSLVFQRLQRISRAPNFCLRVQHASRAPDLHTSMFLRLQRISRPLLRQRPQARSMPSELQIARSLASTRLQPPELHTSLRHHVCTLAACLYVRTSSSLHLQHASGAPELLGQTPLRPYAGSAPLELRGSWGKYLHICTPAAYLQTPIPPHLYVPGPAACFQGA